MMVMNRIVASAVIGIGVFVLGGIVVTIGRLLGDQLWPLVFWSFVVAVGAFVVDSIMSWVETP